MALEVNCSVPGCGLPMTMPGAVVVSPPMGYSTKRMQVTKYHICALCWATKFYKLLDDGEFENDAARWAHIRNAEFFPVGRPRTTFVKDQSVEGMPPELDIVAIMAQAWINKRELEIAEVAALAENRVVPNYCQTDVELMDIMLEHDRFWQNRKKKHPVWVLIKRGWL